MPQQMSKVNKWKALFKHCCHCFQVSQCFSGTSIGKRVLQRRQQKHVISHVRGRSRKHILVLKTCFYPDLSRSWHTHIHTHSPLAFLLKIRNRYFTWKRNGRVSHKTVYKINFFCSFLASFPCLTERVFLRKKETKFFGMLETFLTWYQFSRREKKKQEKKSSKKRPRMAKDKTCLEWK